MTQFAKAYLSTEGDTLRMGMDISKVDKKGRMVYGWATLDNVDHSGDVITAEASKDAFARSRFNLREMHKKDSAVGRVVSFKEDTFRAPDGNEYRGIFVKAYISKGAEDTWQKVLDKTLNGFSIGGEIVDAEEIFQKDSGKKGKLIKKYNLNELSLVDNPDNMYSDITNIFKFRTSADGSVTSVTGLIEKQAVLNVFYCKEDGLTQEKPDESYDCPVCDVKMENIGFVENGGEVAAKVNSLLTKYRGGETMSNMSLEGLELIKSQPAGEDVNEVEDGTDTGIEPTPQPPVQEGEDVTEVEDVQSEVVKQIDSLKQNVEHILSKASAETKSEIAELRKSIETATEDFKTKTSEFEQKLSEFDENLKLTKSRITDAEARLEKANNRSALRKSVDGSDDTATVEEQSTPWEGTALDVRSAFSVSQYL